MLTFHRLLTDRGVQTETPPPRGGAEEEGWAWPGAWQGAGPSAKGAAGPMAGLVTWVDPELCWRGGKVRSKELLVLKRRKKKRKQRSRGGRGRKRRMKVVVDEW